MSKYVGNGVLSLVANRGIVTLRRICWRHR